MKAEIETEVLVEKLRKTTDKAARKALEEKLRKQLDKAFDVRLQNRKAELDMLKKEVVEIEAMIEKRKNNKQKIVERHFRDLTDADEDDDDLAW